MPYRVRTPDGELDFPHLSDVAQAYAAGLVDPDDEVREPGSDTWRKASTLPALAGTRARARDSGRAQHLRILVAVALGVLSLYLSFFHPSRTANSLGLLLALVLAVFLMRVTASAFQRRSR